MALTSNKKRKIVDENRKFQSEWTHKLGFVENKGIHMCLICKITVPHNKLYNLSRHYEKFHSQFAKDYPLNTNLRETKLKALQSNIEKEQTIISSFSHGNDRSVEPSYIIAWDIARYKRPYGKAELRKHTMKKFINILDTNNKKQHKALDHLF